MSQQEARLLEEFAYPTYEEWRAAAESTLKGVPFEKKLITRTYEGIEIQPMYRQEDTAQIAHQGTLPGFPPYVRSIDAAGYTLRPWDICQEITNATPEAWNAALRSDLERGQTAINMVLDRATRVGQDADTASVEEVGNDGLSLSSLEDLSVALDGIDLDQVPVLIQAGVSALPFAALLVVLARKRGTSLAKLTGCIGMDPLGTLAAEGTLPLSLDEAYGAMAHLVAWTRANAPDVQTIFIQAQPYHDGGASTTQDLAFVLATGVDYLRELQSRGIAIDDAALSMRFSFSIGSNVFMEIARLRAARMLWAKIVRAFGGSDTAQKMVIHARTSAWNKTVYDPYVNMLRTTTEAFAGVVGGCNSLYVAPFDETIRPSDEFSRRIARNTQLILLNESHLDKMIDPAGGSWYVESLTDEIGRRAWGIFQEIEQQGGMQTALQAGGPQQQVAQTAEQRMQNIAQRRDIFVGTNMYPNAKEKPLEMQTATSESLHRQRSETLTRYRGTVDQGRCTAALEKVGQMSAPASAEVVEAAIEAAAAGATIGQLAAAQRSGGEAPSVNAICIFRGAEPFEQVRKASEAYATRTGTPPRVFLANMGPIPQHKPRADFSIGFLEVGGFEVINNSGFPTVDEAAQAAREASAPIVVICSTDDTYPELVPPLAQQIKQNNPQTVVLLAGYPKEHVESFKAAGVDDFIHLRANCYEMLVNLQKQIGVTA